MSKSVSGYDKSLPYPSGVQQITESNEQSSHVHDCSEHGGSGIGGVFQTLQELDFERGPWSAAVNGDLTAITKYLTKGGEPNLCDSSGYTALHYSARNGHRDISLLLLKHGASVNAATKAGKSTALHRAVMSKSVDVVSLLLQYHASPCTQDADGKTPLHKAVEARNPHICRMLIDSDPNCMKIQDRNGKEAKHYAGGMLEDNDVNTAMRWSKS